MSRTKKDSKKHKAKKGEGEDYGLLGGVPSEFKKHQKRSRRAKENAAMKKGEEPPLFKKSDEYDYY